MNLSKNQVIRFKNTTLNIHCLSGILWLTWPDSHDRILKPGQSASVTSRGDICIQAFCPSALRLDKVKKRWWELPDNIFKKRITPAQ